VKPSPRRNRGGYFPNDSSTPAPLVVRVRHRVRFSEVDAMAVMWHGRYASLFEQANEDLCKMVGMGYADFYREKLKAPIVQLHVDYFAPTLLGEDVEIIGRLFWNEGARINMEYEIYKPDGTLAATGYTVQMFVEEGGTPLLASPTMLEKCRGRWRAGEFKALR
jgi:acyl-CoA thioester hydrolase